MDKHFGNVDWALVQAFLAVAETGSLSAAARQLGRSQPTLGRQIKTLGVQLGADLFVRQPRGYAVTPTGAELIAPARTMRDAVRQMALSAGGQQTELAGTVRITASVAMSVHHLPKIIARLRQDVPSIAIELVPSDVSSNLLYREADIAVRMYRPTQLDLVTQHLGDIPLGMFASETYLARHGVPQTAADLMTHDIVGYDKYPEIIAGFQAAGFPVDRDFFKIRCDDGTAYWAMVRAGCGIGFAQKGIGIATAGIQEIPLGFALPVLPVWLTAHAAMRQTPRIRRVWDALAQGLRPLVS